MDNINLKKVRPIFNGILVTAVKEEIPNQAIGKIITTEALQLGYKNIQTVVAIGNTVTVVKPGEMVFLDFSKYAIFKQKQDNLSVKQDMDEHYHRQIVGYALEPLIIDGVEHLMLYDRDIQYVIEEVEEIKQSLIIQTTPLII